MSGRLMVGLFGSALASCLIAASPASAGPGDLDPSFSKDGKTVTDLGDRSWPVGAIPADGGKVLAVGNAGRASGRVVLVRYRRDGSLDRSFGEAGIVRTEIAETAIDAIGLPSGQTVVAASNGGPAVFARFQPDGSLDRSFGDDGRRVVSDVDIDTWSSHVIAAAPDGGIIVLCFLRNVPGFTFGVFRLTPEGDVDPSFGGDGMVTGDPQLDDSGVDLAVASDGRITVLSNSLYEESLWRYTPGGEHDPTFSGDGLSRMNYPGALTVIALREDGSVLAGGRSGETLKGYVVRAFTLAGEVDTSFSEDGVAAIDPLHARGSYPAEMAVQRDGRIVVGGDNYYQRIGVVRFLPDGRPDRPFGFRGGTNVGFGGVDDTFLGGLYATPRGQVLVAASTGDGPPQFGLARFGSRGPADLDADGEHDGADLCPDVWGRASSGCPAIGRKVTHFHYVARKRFFRGKLESPEYACEGGRVEIFRRQPGRDKLVGADRALGDFAVPYPPREGSYYALAPPRRVSNIGLCTAARSGVIHR